MTQELIHLENDGESEVCCMCYKHESGHVPDAILTICGPKSCHICGNEIPLCRKHAEQLINEIQIALRPNPDVWAEDPEYSRSDWRDEVYAGDTNLGYWDWVRNQREMNAEVPE